MSYQDWITGNRAAWRAVLSQACRELGVGDSKADKVRWALEREEAIAALRRACKDHGSNDWNEKLNLSDIIDKYLVRYLNEKYD